METQTTATKTETTMAKTMKTLSYKVSTRYGATETTTIAAARRIKRDEIKDGWTSHIYSLETGVEIQ